MLDYISIAKEYAEELGCDIIKPSAVKGGYHYFYLNRTVRPRYLGHPHVIKISPSGKVQRVLDFEEIYWAYKKARKEE
jgi:hypothetical protein